jgi:hypothetical protein
MRERTEVSFSCRENGRRARRFPIKTPHLFTSPRKRGEGEVDTFPQFQDLR